MTKSRATLFRAKAVICEGRAAETKDPSVKQEWVELAVEWHALAGQVAVVDGDDEKSS